MPRTRETASPPSTSSPPVSRPSQAPFRPTTIGQYTVVGKIAGGGLSTIYLARTSTGGTVALKVIRNDLSADAEITRMFVAQGVPV